VFRPEYAGDTPNRAWVRNQLQATDPLFAAIADAAIIRELSARDQVLETAT
jgi:hypothetical protein